MSSRLAATAGEESPGITPPTGSRTSLRSLSVEVSSTLPGLSATSDNMMINRGNFHNIQLLPLTEFPGPDGELRGELHVPLLQAEVVLPELGELPVLLGEPLHLLQQLGGGRGLQLG